MAMATKQKAKTTQRGAAKRAPTKRAMAGKSAAKRTAKKAVKATNKRPVAKPATGRSASKTSAKKSVAKKAATKPTAKPAVSKKPPTRASAPAKRATASANDVTALIAAMPPPQRDALNALRDIILAADASIAEGVKWNSPSFRTSEYFATMNHRPGKGLMVVLHLGAKVRDTAKTGIAVNDPTGLLQWLAKDRAVLTFADLPAVQAQRGAFATLIRSWIRHV
jgi:hypothetical protein